QVEYIITFLLQAIPYLLLLCYHFTRLNTLLSLWTRQSVVSMVLGIFMILLQFIYYGSDSTELLEMNITWLPQTYIDFGKVLTGRLEEQLLIAIPNIFNRRLIVLGVTILVIEGLIYASSKII